MSSTSKDRTVFECDDCGETFEGERGEDFKDAWARAKDEGWRAYKDDDGKWQHSCPDCG